MIDFDAGASILFVGLVTGLMVTLGHWAYVGVLAWRRFRKTTDLSSAEIWWLSVRKLFRNTNYLWFFMLAASLAVLVPSVVHIATGRSPTV